MIEKKTKVFIKIRKKHTFIKYFFNNKKILFIERKIEMNLPNDKIGF